MSIIDTRHKRKSLAITIVLMCLLMFFLFFAGLKYMDPPPENGIAIILGVEDKGMGVRTPVVPQQNTASEASQKQTEEIKQEQEKIVTQEIEESVVIPTEEKIEKKKEQTPKTENKPKPTQEVKAQPKPSQETTEALANILGATNANQTGTQGQGDDNTLGYKGDPKGNPYANSYYGMGGTGNAGWGLNGRKLVAGEIVKQECNQAGKVVVQIEVDQTGKVIKATPGVRGTTNNDPCLLEPARQTALKHRWNTDENAPAKQIGFIEINFRLGE